MVKVDKGWGLKQNKNMAKKTDDLVTKKYLDKRLSKFKVEIKEEIREELVEFSEDIQDRFDKTTRKFKDEIKDDMYKFKDEIIGEFNKHDEDDKVHEFSHVRINEELEDHDLRISQLQAAG